MPNYFPEGSDRGDTKARAEIWIGFDAFKSLAMDSEKAALALISMAETGDVSDTMVLLNRSAAPVNPVTASLKNNAIDTGAKQ